MNHYCSIIATLYVNDGNEQFFSLFGAGKAAGTELIHYLSWGISG